MSVQVADAVSEVRQPLGEECRARIVGLSRRLAELLSSRTSPLRSVTHDEQRYRSAGPSECLSLIHISGFDICYVNGFQTQPAESDAFAKLHPELVVRANGVPVVDPGWPDEYVFDTSTLAKRTALAAIVEPWIEGCKAAGFSAVEIDNLDSYTRVGDALTAEDNIAMATTFADIAHRQGLSIAQKNTADQADRLRRVGYDFAITESCVAQGECSVYTSHYPVVLDIEYTDELAVAAFVAACAGGERPPIMTMRDHHLVTPRDPAYFYQSCTP